MIYLEKIIEKVFLKNINFKNKFIKLGIDSTNFSLHLGHLVLINFIYFLYKKKYKFFIIIGDYTAIIKKNIDLKKNLINSICLKSQIYNLLGNIKIFFNSIWFKKINFFYLLKICELININNYIKKSIKKILLKKISIKKIIYPILQSLDSVLLNIDIEIGGSDQLFNILCCRYIQNFFNLKKQNAIFFKILEQKGKKISKSNNIFLINKYNNFVIKNVFFNLKNYIKNINKKKKYLIFFLNLKIKLFKKKIKNYFKIKTFFSFYLKKILKLNKFNFYNSIYKKNFFLNNKLLIKNFILKKKYYLFFFKEIIYIYLYDK